jgi:hemoglobin
MSAHFHRLRPKTFVLALLALLLTVPALADTDASLYSRMGGAPVVNAIAAQLIDRTSSDTHLQRSFNKVNLVRVKKLLAEQLCALAGGPCAYSGDSMAEVHAGLDIRQDEFYGMVEILRKVMEHNGVRPRERNELLALLAPMKRDVVTR